MMIQQNTLSFEEMKSKIQNLKVHQANYQPVMIKMLLESKSSDRFVSRLDIANELMIENSSSDKTISHYRSCPVYDVLTKKGIVIPDKESRAESFKINALLDEIQKNTLIGMCIIKIVEADSK